MSLLFRLDSPRPRQAGRTPDAATQPVVQIARPLSVSVRVLSLDEPSAALRTGEMHRLRHILRRLRASGTTRCQ